MCVYAGISEDFEFPTWAGYLSKGISQGYFCFMWTVVTLFFAYYTIRLFILISQNKIHVFLFDFN